MSLEKEKKWCQSIGYFENRSKGGSNCVCLIVLNALLHLPRNRMNVNRWFLLYKVIDEELGEQIVFRMI